MESYYRGDTIELSFQLYKDSSTGELWDLTDCEIRFQVSNKDVILKKATANIFGGSNEQILIVDVLKGKFLVGITKDESSKFNPGTYTFEIEITTPENKRFTVFKDSFNIVKDSIDWETIS